MTLETNKMLGGIGAILMFIGVLPLFNYSTVISLVGAILVLAALNGLAGYFKDRGIFNNALYALIVGIVAVVVVVTLLFTVVLSNATDLLRIIYPGWDGNWASLQNMTPDTNAFTSGNFDFATFTPLIIDFVIIWVVVWITSIVGTFFLRRSLKAVSDKSQVGLFGTAGLLMLIGGFLTVVIIGVFLIWIGILLLAIAFFQIKPPEPAVYATQAPPPMSMPPA